MRSIVLLNSEGAILRANRFSSARFDIVDQYNCLVDELNTEEMNDFVHGNREIIDSKNKIFKYSTFPGSMKPDLKELDEFIGIDTTGRTY
jgi:hypothetical protein